LFHFIIHCLVFSIKNSNSLLPVQIPFLSFFPLDQEFTNCLLEKKGALEFEVLEHLSAQSPLGSDSEGEQKQCMKQHATTSTI
jgi:hypothetical protein